MKIGIIGAGNMGEAIIKGLAGQKKHTVFIAEDNMKQATIIIRRYKVKKLTLEQLSKTCKIIIICVKPQNIDEVLNQLSVGIQDNQVVISIAAGVSTGHISNLLKAKASVIRVMPNMPGMIGQGISAYCLGRYAKKNNALMRKLSEEVFSGLGKTIFTTEDKMNAITALSGSGPGFIAYLTDGLMQAGRAVGLNEEESHFFTIHMIAGSSLALVQDQNILPSEFVKKVASKGGTTEAGLRIFDKEKINNTIKKAIRAATKRAKELSKN